MLTLPLQESASELSRECGNFAVADLPGWQGSCCSKLHCLLYLLAMKAKAGAQPVTRVSLPAECKTASKVQAEDGVLCEDTEVLFECRDYQEKCKMLLLLHKWPWLPDLSN